VVKRPSSGSANRRGSPEAVAKRRAGRAFNELLQPGGGRNLDGRSQKRRARLLRELTTGRRRGSGRPLKPLDVLAHVDQLLGLGESADALRKACRPVPMPLGDPELVRVLADLHEAYGFRPETYRIAGLDERVLRRAGIPSAPSPRGRRPARPG
jgi:hypothetical protein